VSADFIIDMNGAKPHEHCTIHYLRGTTLDRHRRPRDSSLFNIDTVLNDEEFVELESVAPQ
jgi:hypothetical protein